MTAPVVAEIGDLLVYSFSESGGRLAIDATSGIYSDYKILDGKLQGKIDQNENYRFSVLVNTGPIVKYDAQYYIKSYVYPGTYTLTAWLDNKGPFKWTVFVYDGKFVYHRKKTKYLAFNVLFYLEPVFNPGVMCSNLTFYEGQSFFCSYEYFAYEEYIAVFTINMNNNDSYTTNVSIGDYI